MSISACNGGYKDLQTYPPAVDGSGQFKYWSKSSSGSRHHVGRVKLLDKVMEHIGSEGLNQAPGCLFIYTLLSYRLANAITKPYENIALSDISLGNAYWLEIKNKVLVVIKQSLPRF